jgi:hypothetical protein
MPKLPEGFLPATVASSSQIESGGREHGGFANLNAGMDPSQPGFLPTSEQILAEHGELARYVLGEENTKRLFGFVSKTYWATWLNLLTLFLSVLFWPLVHVSGAQADVDYWEMSFLHSIICLIAIFFIYKHLHAKIRFAWWFGANEQKPYQVSLMLFSTLYLAFNFQFYEDWPVIFYNGFCIAFFLYSIFAGKYIQLLVTHLFFSELGSLVWSGESIIHARGAWAGLVGVWLCLTRLAWCYWCYKYVFRPYRDNVVVAQNQPWGCLDYTSFYTSIFICITCLLYGAVHLLVEIESEGERW